MPRMVSVSLSPFWEYMGGGGGGGGSENKVNIEALVTTYIISVWGGGEFPKIGAPSLIL